MENELSGLPLDIKHVEVRKDGEFVVVSAQYVDLDDFERTFQILSDTYHRMNKDNPMSAPRWKLKPLTEDGAGTIIWTALGLRADI